MNVIRLFGSQRAQPVARPAAAAPAAALSSRLRRRQPKRPRLQNLLLGTDSEELLNRLLAGPDPA